MMSRKTRSLRCVTSRHPDPTPDTPRSLLFCFWVSRAASSLGEKLEEKLPSWFARINQFNFYLDLQRSVPDGSLQVRAVPSFGSFATLSASLSKNKYRLIKIYFFHI